MNILINYLYRDAANYKQWDQVVFNNPKCLSVNDIEARIRSRLINETSFVARDVRLKELFVHKFDPLLDHNWHEVDSVSATEKSANDLYGRTIEEFISELTSWWCLYYR